VDSLKSSSINKQPRTTTRWSRDRMSQFEVQNERRCTVPWISQTERSPPS